MTEDQMWCVHEEARVAERKAMGILRRCGSLQVTPDSCFDCGGLESVCERICGMEDKIDREEINMICGFVRDSLTGVVAMLKPCNVRSDVCIARQSALVDAGAIDQKPGVGHVGIDQSELGLLVRIWH